MRILPSLISIALFLGIAAAAAIPSVQPGDLTAGDIDAVDGMTFNTIGIVSSLKMTMAANGDPSSVGGILNNVFGGVGSIFGSVDQTVGSV